MNTVPSASPSTTAERPPAAARPQASPSNGVETPAARVTLSSAAQEILSSEPVDHLEEANAAWAEMEQGQAHLETFEEESGLDIIPDNSEFQAQAGEATMKNLNLSEKEYAEILGDPDHPLHDQVANATWLAEAAIKEGYAGEGIVAIASTTFDSLEDYQQAYQDWALDNPGGSQFEFALEHAAQWAEANPDEPLAELLVEGFFPMYEGARDYIDHMTELLG